MTKYCIAGKNNIAVSILEYLLFEKKTSKDDIVVCCNKSDGGKNTWQRSLRFTALQLGIQEVSLEDVYDVPDLVFLSLEFDRIIKPSLFKTKKLFNIHFSLLPAYKGMYTAALPILNNEKYVGVTFHYIDSGIDTGAVIAQKKIPLGFYDTARDVYLKNIECGTELVKECIDKYMDSGFECPATPQNPMESSYNSARAIDYENMRVDLNQTALSVHNQIRAFNFREYQLPQVGGRKIRFCRITPNRSTQRAGTIIWQDDDCLMVAAIDYDIALYVDKFEAVIESCKAGDMEALKRIQGLPHYVNEKEVHGWTPLIAATYNGLYDMAMFLVANGADIHAKNNNGTNLLMYAKDAFVRTGDSRLFDFYCQKGLPLGAKDYAYKSLAEYCEEQKIERIGESMIYSKIDGGGGTLVKYFLPRRRFPCGMPLRRIG